VNKHEGIKLISILKLSDLSNRSLVLCSQFSRELKKLDGKGLVLQDPHLPKSIAKAMLNNRSAKLTEVFEKLLKELGLDTEQTDINNNVASKEKRYRGLVQDTKQAAINKKNENTSTVKESSAAKMYRGVPLAD